MTLGVGAVVGIVGLRPAWFVFAPGYVVAWFGTGSELAGMVAFLGVNVATWWTVWAARHDRTMGSDERSKPVENPG
jgi:hypothetical protein